jgi:hypothetical protein
LATAGIEVVKLEAEDGRILRGWFRSFLRAGVHAEQEQSAKGEDRNACHDFDPPSQSGKQSRWRRSFGV